MRQFFYFFFKSLIISSAFISFFYIIWILISYLFYNWIVVKHVFELIYIIFSPFLIIFFYLEIYIIFRSLFWDRWYEKFIEEYSILAYCIINNKIYMPHDLLLDIFFFMLYRFPDTKLSFYLKWIIFLIISGLSSPILLFILIILTILSANTSLILSWRLWRNAFWRYDENKTIARFVNIDEISVFWKSPTLILFLFFSHNLPFVSIYYKLFFFGRRNIYYHNLPILEKIKIFNDTYFKIVNRDANFWWLIVVFFFFSIFEVIFFNSWQLSKFYKFPKIFLFKFFKTLIKNYFYLARAMSASYSLKKIKCTDEKLIL